MVNDIVCGTCICNLRQSTVHFSSTITINRTIYPQKYDQPFINQIFVDMVDGIVCGICNLRQSTVHFISTITIIRTVQQHYIYPKKYSQPFINQIFVYVVDGFVCGMSNLTTLRQQ